MKAVIYLGLAIFTLMVKGSMLRCGEDIIVQRGEKKTLRFWSTDDELLKVEMVPVREQSDASALLAIFKNSYNQGSKIFESRDDIIASKDSLDNVKVDEEETLYRIDDKILENFNNHLLSRTEISDIDINQTVSSNYEETISGNSSMDIDRDEQIIIKPEEYYETNGEDGINGENLEYHQEYALYDDREVHPKLDSYDYEENNVTQEETNKFHLKDASGFQDKDLVDSDISTTENFSVDKITTNEPSDEWDQSEVMNSQVTKSSELEYTTKDSTISVTIFDNDFKEKIANNNDMNQITEIDSNTEEYLSDLHTEPVMKTENLWTTEEYTIPYSSQSENLEGSSTDNPEEENSYEFRHGLSDSTLSTDIPNMIMSTESDVLTTDFESPWETEINFAETDATTATESSTIIPSDVDSHTEIKMEMTASTDEEQNHNEDLFSSNPLEDFITSKTESSDNNKDITLAEHELDNEETSVTTYTTSSLPINIHDQTESTLFETSNPTTVDDEERETPTTENIQTVDDIDKELSSTTEAIQYDTESHQEESHVLFHKENEKHEATVRKEELNDIISELKSQEALLSQPNSKEGSSDSVSMEENSESVDIKLNILKNIIKGITSEIAANDKAYSQTEIDNNMQQTHLIYPEEDSKYDDSHQVSNNDFDDRGHKTDEITKGKIHIQDSFENKEGNIFTLPKTKTNDPSELSLLRNNEIILPNIYNEDMKDSSIKDNEQRLTTIEDQGMIEDLSRTTMSSSIISSELTDIPNLDAHVNNNIIVTKNNEFDNDKNKDLRTESVLQASPEDGIDIKKSEIEKSLVEELYLPFDFLGVINDKTSSRGHDVDEQADNIEQTTSVDESNEPVDSLISNKEENFIINNEPERSTSDFQNNVKSMKKDVISVSESTAFSSTELNTEVSTGTEVLSYTENPEVRSVIDEDSIFSKETGSDNVVSLLRNSLLHTNDDDDDDIGTKDPQKDNSILLSIHLFSPKDEQIPHLYSKQKSDNQVLIKEPGSKVVIIKPNLDILKAKKEHDATSLTFNTETGNYEVEIESTTSTEPEFKDYANVALEASNNDDDYLQFENVEQEITTKIPESEMVSETSQLPRTTESPETKTEAYVSFGIVKVQDPAANTTSDNSPSQHSLTDTSLRQDYEEYNENKSNLDDISVFKTDITAISSKDNYKEDLEHDNIYEFSNNKKETGSYYNDYPEYGEDISNTEELQHDYDVSDTEQLQRKINTELSHTEPSEDYLANHRISEPLPYLLQTRKGFVDADAPFIRAGSAQHRRDDSQQSFGGESPFYIKLPGSQNAVPVFLQYEPVKVKYVNADKFFKKKPVVEDAKLNESEMGNDLSSTFYKENLKDKSKIKDKPAITLEQIANAHMNVDFHLRPDPFYVMDAPNLANEKEKINEDQNEVDSFAVDVESTLGIQKDDSIPSVIKGDKPVYPGEYFIKNPDNSYSSSDTSSLTNPVFSLGSKVTLPPRGSGILQYTPFPLTTNPPKIPLPDEAENLIEDIITTQQNVSNLKPSDDNDTDIKFNYPTENPPSIEYSPIPSIDYPDSYGPFEYADPSYTENNESKFYEDGANEFSSVYPDKAYITDVKNDKLLDGPLKKNSDFDIVALANFLHQNQKVWSNPKATPIPEGGLWRSPSWDDVINSAEQTNDSPDSLQVASPWAAANDGLGEERFYSAFHSPEEVPGIDPAFFSYRKMPKNIKDSSPESETIESREKRSLDSQIKEIVRYIESIPMPMQDAVINLLPSDSRRILKRSVSSAGEHVYCEWNIKTEPGLYLLVTFHNLSAPYTVDCYGAYIEVERENNGYDARWCGNRGSVAGTRPHVIFAKSEVRITVYDNGDAAKTFPTGFEADIEVIDLFDSEDYKFFMEKRATPKIRKLMEG